MVSRLAISVVAAALGAAACGDFEQPDIVLDLRILAVSVTPPEIVVEADPDQVSITDLPEVELCALIADPGDSRRLSYRMTACPPRRERRCDDPDDPSVDIGGGSIDDPEEADTPVTVCQTLRPNGSLIAVLMESVRADDLAGFGGISVQIELQVEPDGAPDAVQYAAKKVRYAARVPDNRVANTNPFVDQFTIAREATGERNRGFAAPIGRCNDVEPASVLAGEKITIFPVAGEGTREDYVVPTFDGDVREFTENLDYAWFSTHGDWTAGTTGGPPNLATGAIEDPDTQWIAPDDPDIVGDGLDVRMWFVQRDERGGLAWYESCVRVEP